jgi:hypothetical protein
LQRDVQDAGPRAFSQSPTPPRGNGASAFEVHRPSLRRAHLPVALSRFWIVDLLPTILLFLIVLGLVSSGTLTGSPQPDHVLDAIDALNVQRVTVLLTLAIAISVLLHPFQFALVRVLEGYWHAWTIGRFLARPAVAWQRHRRRRLETIAWSDALTTVERQRKALATARLLTYPAEARLLPTRLGNVMRAAEDDAGQRYGLDTVTMLPRLYPHLSAATREMLSDMRNQLDASVRFCFALLVAATLSAVGLARHGWWLVTAMSVALAWLAYRAAIRAAVGWGQGLYLAFDLHRFEMLRALHAPLPADRREEIALNRRVSRFFVTGRPSDDPYDHSVVDDHQAPSRLSAR